MARVILQRVWNPSKLLHNTPKGADAFFCWQSWIVGFISRQITTLLNQCVIQLLKYKQQEKGRKFQGGLIDNVMVNGGQNYKIAHPRWKLEAQSSKMWRWLLPGDLFRPWKSISVHKNHICGLALKGGAQWMALFWGVSSFYVLKS